MDNVTHTLIGAAFARALPERFRRPEIYWASVLANNAPDSDVIVHFLPGSTDFDYLLHHRGYTHTLLAVPLLGLLSAAAAKRIARAERWTPALVAVSLFGGMLHIGADALNNYGVHPLTPFCDRWFYGDTLFIVEPLIWFALLPFLAREAERPWARIAWISLTLGMVGLVWLFPTFSSGLSAGLTMVLAVTAFSALRARTRSARVAIPLGLFAATIAAFAFAGARARSFAREAWAAETRGAETELDVASSPNPGNPICWNVWIGARGETEFRFRTADVSIWPSLYSATECGAFSRPARTAEILRSDFPPTPTIRWNGEVPLPIAKFETFRARSARFRRLLEFARFPFVREFPDGSAIAGDLRYDREEGTGFAEITIPVDEAPGAPKPSPNWEAPFLRGRP